jgi:hypothetical protein
MKIKIAKFLVVIFLVFILYASSHPIQFSNGYLDPWSGGGWNLEPHTERSGSLVSLIVEDGAHHYDLRGSHPDDTPSVRRVRAMERAHIRAWISEAEERRRKSARKTAAVTAGKKPHGHHAADATEGHRQRSHGHHLHHHHSHI